LLGTTCQNTAAMAIVGWSLQARRSGSHPPLCERKRPPQQGFFPRPGDKERFISSEQSKENGYILLFGEVESF
jgi:hypothetical protein